MGGSEGRPKHSPPVTASPAPSTGEVRASNDCHLGSLGGDWLRRSEAKALARKRLGGGNTARFLYLCVPWKLAHRPASALLQSQGRLHVRSMDARRRVGGCGRKTSSSSAVHSSMASGGSRKSRAGAPRSASSDGEGRRAMGGRPTSIWALSPRMGFTLGNS